MTLYDFLLHLLKWHTVLEERANFRKESANGLYTALPFVLANSVVTLPFLVMCSTIFVLIMYWGIVSAIELRTLRRHTDCSLLAELGVTSGRSSRLPIHWIPVTLHLCRGKPGTTHRGFHTDPRRRSSDLSFLEWLLDESFRLLFESCQPAKVLVLLFSLVSSRRAPSLSMAD